MFAFRLRVLKAGEDSYLGIVEGFPEIMVHSITAAGAEADLVRGLIDYLERLQDRETTRIEWDDFPAVRTVTLSLGPPAG